MDYLSRLTAILILLNCISFFIRKYKGVTVNELYCGLFGFSGWDKANIAKLKLLGLYNKTRGRDSCGYYFNGKLAKGTYLKKEWDAFIEDEIISDKDGKSNLFIGHTRSSTVGQNTEENAHPFNVKDKLIIAHNGTLDNHWPLCNKYGIDHSKIHVDSLALGNLIVDQGYKILEEYKGYAALLMHYPAEEDSLYVYHGASRVYDTDEKLTEERPLFYMKSKEGIYISSLKQSLLAIRESELEKPEIVPHNRVIKITKGKPAKGFTVIKRDNANIGLEKKTVYYTKPAPTLPAQSNYTKHPSQGPVMTGKTTQEGGRTGTNYSPAANSGMGTAVLPSLLDFKLGKDIALETKPPRCFNKDWSEFNYMYYQRGRYYQVDDNLLAHGCFFLDKDGVIFPEKRDKVSAKYFFNGVCIKDEHAWSEIQNHIDTKSAIGVALTSVNVYDFAKYISKYSRYPVSNIEDEGKYLADSMRKTWWKDFKPASGSTQPIYSSRNYVFEMGVLQKIESEDKNDKIFMTKDTDEWINHKFYLNGVSDENAAEKGDFDNGEQIVKEYPTLKTITKFFDMAFTSTDQCFDECPSTILDALALYLQDTVGTSYKLDADEMADAIVKFIEIAVSDNVTLRENMENGFPSAEHYVKQAYMAEISDDFDAGKSMSKHIENLCNFHEPDVKIADEEHGSCSFKKKEETETKREIEVSSVPFTDYEIVDDNTVYLTRNEDKSFSIKRNKVKEGKVVQMKLSLDRPVDTLIREVVEINDETQAITQVRQLIVYLKFLCNKTDRLKGLDKSSFAQETAFKMAEITNTFKDDLSSVITKHNKEELQEDIKKVKCPTNDTSDSVQS